MNDVDPPWRMCRIEDSHGVVAHANRPSELESEPGLEELGIAFEVEAIQTPDAIGGYKAQIIRQVPVHHRRESLEFPSPQSSAVQVDIGKARDQLHGARTAGEDWPLGYYLSKCSLDRIVSTCLSSDAPRGNEVTTVDGRIVG